MSRADTLSIRALRLVTFLALSSSLVAQAGDFVDTRLNFTLTNENVLVKPGETNPSVPGWRFGQPNQLGILFLQANISGHRLGLDFLAFFENNPLRFDFGLAHLTFFLFDHQFAVQLAFLDGLFLRDRRVAPCIRRIIGLLENLFAHRRLQRAHGVGIGLYREQGKINDFDTERNQTRRRAKGQRR